MGASEFSHNADIAVLPPKCFSDLNSVLKKTHPRFWYIHWKVTLSLAAGNAAGDFHFGRKCRHSKVKQQFQAVLLGDGVTPRFSYITAEMWCPYWPCKYAQDQQWRNGFLTFLITSVNLEGFTFFVPSHSLNCCSVGEVEREGKGFSM